jgi:murein DD-endopeptidase MepM/ murein hydrolase activator NlpD
MKSAGRHGAPAFTTLREFLLIFKNINIFFVPDGTSNVKQFKIPLYVPLIAVLLVIFCSASVFLLIRDYRTLKSKMPRLALLERENELRREQFTRLAERIDTAAQKMCDLKEFERKLRIMVNLEPDGGNPEYRGVGGSGSGLSDPRQVKSKTHKDLVRKMHRSLDTIDNDIALGERGKVELFRFLKSQKMLLASTPSIWPTRGWVTCRFGYRTSPFTGQREFHKGIDIAARSSAPIVAPADGMVSSINWDRGYGRILTIKHGYGVVTRYAHLRKSLVKKGHRVRRGETIALVGNSGRSTGPHLHYEVHLNGVPVNPFRYILN